MNLIMRLVTAFRELWACLTFVRKSKVRGTILAAIKLQEDNELLKADVNRLVRERNGWADNCSKRDERIDKVLDAKSRLNAEIARLELENAKLAGEAARLTDDYNRRRLAARDDLIASRDAFERARDAVSLVLRSVDGPQCSPSLSPPTGRPAS